MQIWRQPVGGTMVAVGLQLRVPRPVVCGEFSSIISLFIDEMMNDECSPQTEPVQ
jgi:hypothetical protein